MKRIILLSMMFLAALVMTACNQADITSTIQSIDETVVREVSRYTPFTSIELPDHVLVTLDSGDTQRVPVSWVTAASNYDASMVGEQTFQGRLILGDAYLNPNNLRPSLTIRTSLVDVMTTLKNQPQFTTLVRALEVSGLDEVLLVRRDMTLLAPTNQAFNELFTLLGETESSFLERDDLYELLLHHVFVPSSTRGALLDQVPFSLNSLDGGSLTFDFDGTRLTVNQLSRLDNTDLMIQNGVIHTVNRVVLSQTILDSIVREFLPTDIIDQFTDLLSDPRILLQFLAGGSSLTIFAPTPEAFEQFTEANNLDVNDLTDNADVVTLLTYHVALSASSAEELFNRAFNTPITLNTLQGEPLTVSVINNDLAVNGAFVTGTEDILAFATIILIDRVLVPPALQETFTEVSP